MSGVTQGMRDREPYRWCIYCDADCNLSESPHADDCPSVTGVHVVQSDMVGPECPHCGERAGHPPVCSDCGVTLAVGDRYMGRVVDPGDVDLPGVEGAAITEVVCVGCAAIDSIKGQR